MFKSLIHYEMNVIIETYMRFIFKNFADLARYHKKPSILYISNTQLEIIFSVKKIIMAQKNFSQA